MAQEHGGEGPRARVPDEGAAEAEGREAGAGAGDCNMRDERGEGEDWCLPMACIKTERRRQGDFRKTRTLPQRGRQRGQAAVADVGEIEMEALETRDRPLRHGGGWRGGGGGGGGGVIKTECVHGWLLCE